MSRVLNKVIIEILGFENEKGFEGGDIGKDGKPLIIESCYDWPGNVVFKIGGSRYLFEVPNLLDAIERAGYGREKGRDQNE